MRPSPLLRKTLLGLIALLGAGCAGRPARVPDEGARLGYTKQKDVIFTPPAWPRELKGDLYVPKTAGANPGILLIYGGNWKSTDNRYQMAGIARKLAARGYVVLNATYRGVPDAIYPAAFDDLREAIRWLRAHAAEHHIDPDRIATWGYSAGGHLAALVGTWPGESMPGVQAIVAGGAPSDLRLFAGRGAASDFMGGTRDEIPERFREASPVAHVTAQTPPTFLYHGSEDSLVPPEHPRAFKAALDRAGVRNELFWIQGRDHIKAFILDRGAEEAGIAFLDRVLR